MSFEIDDLTKLTDEALKENDFDKRYFATKFIKSALTIMRSCNPHRDLSIAVTNVETGLKWLEPTLNPDEYPVKVVIPESP